MAFEDALLGTSGKEAIPFEYQMEQRSNDRKRAIAIEMLKSGKRGPAPRERFGLHVSRRSPFEYLANALETSQGMRGLEDADKAQLALAQRMTQHQGRDMAEVQQLAAGRPASMQEQPQALPGQVTPMLDQAPLPPVEQAAVPGNNRAAIARAMQSQFGRVQGMGAAMQKQEQEMLMQGGKMIGDADPVRGLQFLQGGDSRAKVSSLSVPEPVFMNDPGGNSLALTRDNKGGKPTITYAPKATNVNLNTGSKTDVELDKVTIEMLQKERTNAAEAGATISSAVRSNQLLGKGADAGGGASVRQAARKFAQNFGVDVPVTGLTEELRMRLGENVLAQARKLAPVTGNDVILLQQLLGSIDTDPSALKEVNALMIAKSLMTQDKHNAMVEQSASVSSGAAAKYEPFKIKRQQIETFDGELLGRAYQLMQESGHDMSGYTYNGEPADKIKFNINFTGVDKRDPSQPAGRIKRIQ